MFVSKTYASIQNKKNIFILIIYLLIGFIAATKTGVYADSPIDVQFARFNFGQLVNKQNWLAGFDPSLDSTLATYGYSISILIFAPIWLIGKLFNPNFSLQDPTAIVWRNFGTYLISGIGFYALWKWSRLVLHPKASWVPFLLPVIAPIWFGNSFMNLKDAPIFTGFSAIVYLCSVNFDQKNKGYQISKSESMFWTIIAIVCTVGVRPVMILIILPLLLLMTVFHRVKHGKWPVYTYWGCVISGIYVVLTNYYLLRDPFYWISNLLVTGTSFGWTGAVLSWGNMYRSPDIPGSYLSEILISQVPVFVFVVFLGVIINLSTKKKAIYKNIPVSIYFSFLILLVLIVQAYLLSPILYDNARQLLFLWVFISVLAIWGTSFVLYESDKFRSIKTVLVIFLVVSLIDQVKAFPYNYIYRNEIARVLPPGSFETDYWGISGKEITHWVEKDAQREGNTKATFSYIFQQSFDPYVKETSLISTPIQDLKATYYSQIWRPGLLPDYSAQCPVVFSVDRSFLFGKKEVLGYVRKCE
jgi:hypothetical protein